MIRYICGFHHRSLECINFVVSVGMISSQALSLFAVADFVRLVVKVIRAMKKNY